MKSLVAFIKKDFLEQLRSGRLMILGILFVLFGVMNPAVAKLTPWLLETFATSLEGSGLTVTAVTVTALDSWMQFFKNVPMALIAFILLESNILTREYASGTLILSLTRGLSRCKVVFSKTLVLVTLWTAGYFMHFGITYCYNAYFWDNSIAQSLTFSVMCWWLFDVWVISLVMLFSTVSSSNTGVLLGCGGVVLASYLLGMLPKISKYFPTMLSEGTSLIFVTAEPKDYALSIIITLCVSAVCFAASIPIFNKKSL